MDEMNAVQIIQAFVGLILWFPIMAGLWKLYNRLFTRIYFGNGCLSVFIEFFECGIVALLLSSLIVAIGTMILQGAVSLLGGLLAIVVKIIVFIIKVAVLSAIIYGIYYLVMELKKRRSPEVDFPNQEKSEAVIGIAIIIALVVVGITSCFGRTDGKNTENVKQTASKTVESEYIIPDSDKRYLDEDDVKNLSQDDIYYGVLEIGARHGVIFDDRAINQYFASKSWYKPQYTEDEFTEKMDQLLNKYEMRNMTYLGQLWTPYEDDLASETYDEKEMEEILAEASESPTETEMEETTENPFNRSDLYGIFELHNDRIDASAEIGYYTSEDGGGYLMLDGATSDGSATGSFYGSLVSASGDHFWAQNEDGGSVEFILYEDSIEIVSDEGSEGGMNFPGFTGTYIKTGELSTGG